MEYKGVLREDLYGDLYIIDGENRIYLDHDIFCDETFYEHRGWEVKLTIKIEKLIKMVKSTRFLLWVCDLPDEDIESFMQNIIDYLCLGEGLESDIQWIRGKFEKQDH